MRPNLVLQQMERGWLLLAFAVAYGCALAVPLLG